MMAMVVFPDCSCLRGGPLLVGWTLKFLMAVVLVILVVDSVFPRVECPPKVVPL